MISERIKGWLSTSSKMVAASARMAKKQAELATLNNVTLPRLYHAIGKRIIGSKNLPADLVHHRQRIQELEAAIAAKPEQPTQDTAVGFAAKAKHLAQQAASTTAKATADTASKVKIQAAYVALGKQAIEAYGPQALPQDLREQFENTRLKQTDLSDEIHHIGSTRSNKFFSYGRLALIGTLVCLLLGFVGLRAAGNWLFGNTVRVQKVVTVAKAEGSLPNPNASSGSKRSTASKRSPPTNAFVETVLGPTSHHYSKYGYKDVLLGQTFDEINSTHPLNCCLSLGDGPHIFRKSPGGAESFYFSEDKRLVCYIFSYKGGPRDYLAEIEQVFGEQISGNDSRSERSARFASQSTSRRYVFPKTIVFAEFRKSIDVFSSEEYTHVCVLDREYVERLLRAIAAARWQACQWIKASSICLKTGDISTERCPVMDGCRIKSLDAFASTGVAMFDKRYEDDPDTEALDVFGIKGQVGVVASSTVGEGHFGPQVQFDFRYLTAGLIDTRLHRGVHEDWADKPVFARLGLPFMGMLEGELTAQILHSHFPSEDGAFRLVQYSKNGLQRMLGVYEWEHEDADGDRWAVFCGEDDRTAVVYKPRKTL